MGTTERYLAVMNPAAGGGRCAKEAPAVFERLRAEGIEVDLAETRAAGDGTRIAREAYAAGRRHFIAVGGDGTSYELVNGLFPAATEAAPAGAGDRVSLGFLPLGTGNSFLRDFTDDGAEHSIRALVEGRRRPCDVIRLDHRDGVVHYINILSMGFVADVATLTNRKFKAFGPTGYILGVLGTVAGLAPRTIPRRIDGGPEDRSPETFISVNNSRFTGGKMMMAPNADTGDGFADLITVGPMGRFSLLAAFPKIFKGTHLDLPSVTSERVRAIDFNLEEEIDVMIDGEVLRILPHRLEVLPGVLDVRA